MQWYFTMNTRFSNLKFRQNLLKWSRNFNYKIWRNGAGLFGHELISRFFILCLVNSDFHCISCIDYTGTKKKRSNNMMNWKKAVLLYILLKFLGFILEGLSKVTMIYTRISFQWQRRQINDRFEASIFQYRILVNHYRIIKTLLQSFHFLVVCVVPKYSLVCFTWIRKCQLLRDTGSLSNSTRYTGVGHLSVSVLSCISRVLRRRDKSSVDGLPKRFGWLKSFLVVTSSSLQVLGQPAASTRLYGPPAVFTNLLQANSNVAFLWTFPAVW
jgi:hypothetical protein